VDSPLINEGKYRKKSVDLVQAYLQTEKFAILIPKVGTQLKDQYINEIDSYLGKKKFGPLRYNLNKVFRIAKKTILIVACFPVLIPGVILLLLIIKWENMQINRLTLTPERLEIYGKKRNLSEVYKAGVFLNNHTESKFAFSFDDLGDSIKSAPLKS